MKVRYIITHNYNVTEIIPTNAPGFRYRFKDDKGRYYEHTIGGALKFGGIGAAEAASYAALLAIEQGANRCKEVTLLVERDNGCGWQTYFQGKFAMNDCKFDLCACTMEVKVKPNDHYQCLKENESSEVNILDLPNEVTTKAPSYIPFEFLVCRPHTGAICGSDTQHYTTFYENTTTDDIHIFWREVRITACVAGETQEPEGSGWTELDDNCATNGTAKWTRAPTVSAPAAIDVEAGTCVDIDGVPTAIPPPAPITKAITVGTGLDTQTIIGPDILTVIAIPAQIFKVRFPRDTSSYAWTVTGGGTIDSGAGTSEITVSWANGTGGGAVQCTETAICGAPMVLTQINYTRHTSNPGTWLPYRGITEFYKGEIFTIYLDVWNASRITAWTVTGAAHTILSQDGNTITIRDDSDTGNINIQYWWGSNANPTTLTVTRAGLPLIEPILGPNVVCSGSTPQIFYCEQHYGASYLWSLPAGAVILSGQGTSIITVDMNTAVTGTISLNMKLPISPDYIQVADCPTASDTPYYWVFDDTNGTTYDRSRYLLEAFEYVVKEACSDITEVRSDFFQWKPDNPAFLNYVTGEENKLNWLTIHQKSDVLLPTSGEKATQGEITFKDFAEILMIMFNVRWFVIGDILYIEHVSFWSRQIGLDVTIAPFLDAAPCNRYSYEREKLPFKESFKWSESEGIDFVGKPIEYNDINGDRSPCVGDKEEKYELEVTTDIPYIQAAIAAGDLDLIDREGFVIMANSFDGTDLAVIVERALITAMDIANVHLGWSNLHQHYHIHERPIMDGWMNKGFATFESAIKIKKQKPFTISICCSDNFDPDELITTLLGNGQVESAKENIHNGTIELELLY